MNRPTASLPTLLVTLTVACTGVLTPDDDPMANTTADLHNGRPGRGHKWRADASPPAEPPPPDAPPATIDAPAPSEPSAPPDAAPPPSSSCTLVDSGPITVAANNQVIEGKRITSTSGAAIRVSGYSGVIIRNSEIHHRGGPGIYFSNANGLRIENTIVVHDGAPATGPNPSDGLVNIVGQASTGVVISGVRLVRGSSGIYILDAPSPRLSRVEAYDMRGPFPRGQCVQFDKCSGAILEDFTCVNPASTSWPEDNISIYQSSNVTIRRGVVDGNNSPSGVGIMFEQSDGASSGGLCEDVDAVRQGNGCFSAYPGRNVTFRRTRARDNICADQGRGAPASGGLAWAGSPSSSGLAVYDSRYDNLCHGLIWDASVFVATQLASESFTVQTPVKPTFCWE